MRKLEIPADIKFEDKSDEASVANYEDTGVKYSVISCVAYLIGVPKHIFENEYESPQIEEYKRLCKIKQARIIRNLCILRYKIQRRFTAIKEKITYEYKSLLTVPDYIPPELFAELSEDGVQAYKDIRPQYSLNDYLIDLNKLISNRVNNCRDLFPDWLKWEYVRALFIMPNGYTENGVKAAAALYHENWDKYPYQVYLNWSPTEEGNILRNDKKFVTLLYRWNGDEFTDMSKVSDVREQTKSNIYDFLDHSEKAMIVVDCENSDPYRLCAALDRLDSRRLSKLSKIVLYDDVHTTDAWKILENYTDIPVEYVLIDRIKQDKSLVDIRLATGACREFYTNKVDSFILASSDSDYWGLISSMPDARFLVMVEHEKCGSSMKEALIKANIFYCYLDDFYSGASNSIRTNTLIRETRRYLERNVLFNVNHMMNQVFSASRATMSEEEKKSFYDKYVRKMQLAIDENGNVRLELNLK